jgi:hypothetical protein
MTKTIKNLTKYHTLNTGVKIKDMSIKITNNNICTGCLFYKESKCYMLNYVTINNFTIVSSDIRVLIDNKNIPCTNSSKSYIFVKK